ADHLLDDLAVAEQVQRRDQHDPVPLRGLRVLVHVELDHVELAGVLGGDRLQHRGDLVARAAPLRPVLDDDRLGVLPHLGPHTVIGPPLRCAHCPPLPSAMVPRCRAAQSSPLPCSHTRTSRRSRHWSTASSAIWLSIAWSFASAARTISSAARASAGPSRSRISPRGNPSRLARLMKISRHRSASEYSRCPEPWRSGSASSPRRW